MYIFEVQFEMKIYTSYFANLKILEEHNIFPVSICNKVPSFFKNPNITSVAPTDTILYEYKNSQKTDEDKERYKTRYINEVISIFRFHPEYLTDLLEYFSQQNDNKDIALLCYERPEDFCHRHIFAEWFNEHLNGRYVIEEYPIYPQKKKEITIKSYKLF